MPEDSSWVMNPSVRLDKKRIIGNYGLLIKADQNAHTQGSDSTR